MQASWIGYPGTTGLRAMDYYLADRYFLPIAEFASQFTEKLVHLPATVPFLPAPTAPEVNELPALANGHITFGSFNRLSKLRPSVVAMWSKLLRALPTQNADRRHAAGRGGRESLTGAVRGGGRCPRAA